MACVAPTSLTWLSPDPCQHDTSQCSTPKDVSYPCHSGNVREVRIHAHALAPGTARPSGKGIGPQGLPPFLGCTQPQRWQARPLLAYGSRAIGPGPFVAEEVFALHMRF